MIDEAKEIVMASLDCSSEAAFAVLVAQSERDHKKLRETASEIVARGALPEE